jgi:hypothetical protein
MEGLTVDPEHEDRAHLVLSAAERQLGEDRFGGAWIDRTAPSRPVIGVAAVDPSPRDVDAIDAVARETGWPVQIVAIRYSRAELVGLLESLDNAPSRRRVGQPGVGPAVQRDPSRTPALGRRGGLLGAWAVPQRCVDDRGSSRRRRLGGVYSLTPVSSAFDAPIGVKQLLEMFADARLGSHAAEDGSAWTSVRVR